MKTETLLEHLNYQELKESRYDLAILPWGATEAHNFHLPYGTDNFQTAVIARQAAEIATINGSKVIVLPHIPYGVDTGQDNIPFTMNIMPTTQLAIIKDIAQNLLNIGIKKLLIFNGHRGNDFKSIVREAGAAFKELIICTCNWFEALDPNQYFQNPGEHAGEMETSLMLFLYPEIVQPLSKAGNGQYKKFKVNALNKDWAWAERKWDKISNDTGIGSPNKATAEKGEKFFQDICQVCGRFFKELADTSEEEFYEY